MRVKANMAVRLDDEKTGEVVRDPKVDIYMECSDMQSMRYLKSIIAYANNTMADIIDDVGIDDDSQRIDFEGDGFDGD